MKNKILLILMSLVLLINMYDLRVFANDTSTYDYDELMEYEGFGEIMYESVMRQTTMLTTRYEDNKEYAGQIIDSIGNHANYVFNEINDLNTVKDYMSMMGGLTMTVGDWIKDFFKKADEDNEVFENGEQDYSGWGIAFEIASNGSLALKPGYGVELLYASGAKTTFSYPKTFRVTFRLKSYTKYDVEAVTTYAGNYVVKSFATSSEASEFYNNLNSKKDTVGGYVSAINASGFGLRPYVLGTNRPITNNSFTRINDAVSKIPSNTRMVTPQPIPSLTCPNGMKIPIDINGSTFMDKQGNVMQVNKDGTAFLNDVSCNLTWSVPQMTYINDVPVIELINGDLVDIETREKIGEVEKQPTEKDDENDEVFDFDDELGEGCGTLCALGKLLSGLASIAKAILSIPLKILDGLLELMKKLFVPPDDYFTKEYESLKKSFFNEEIEKNLSDLESLGGAGGGAFEDVNVSIMGANAKIVDASSINKSLDTIHGWVRGIFYPLLLFFNISMLYRLIRGTSFVGIGKKGGGDS